MLVTGVAAYGLNTANDDAGLSGFSGHGDHQKKVHHSKDKSSSKSSDQSKSSDITLDVTMQQNVNNFMFNIPTAFILDVDEYNDNTLHQVYLPDGDEYDWEVDIDCIDFDKANDRNLTSEDVEEYAGSDASATTINGIDGYYSQDGDWETFVFGSGNQLFTISVYGISLEIVLDSFTQEPLVGDTEVEEDSSEDEDLAEEENVDDSIDDTVDDSTADSSYDDSSYDDYADSSYDDSYYSDDGGDVSSSYDEDY